MSNELEQNPITLEELKAAVEAKQFCLWYQPKLSCETLMLKGFEALVRWDHPERGLLQPSRFISLAEEGGLIGAITEQVVDQAFKWYKATSGVQGLTLSINFSARRLSDLDFADWLQRMCRAAAIRTDDVILEISETAVLDAKLLALDMFTRLRTKGFRVAIDDFGIGQSSLGLLAKLPFSEVKIDKSFGMTAATSEDSRAFIKSTVNLSHSLGLTVVGEGVEDRQTFDYLRQVGCDFAHGFFISPPMPPDQALDWILNRRQRTKHILI